MVSKLPRVQRKRHFTAPLHERRRRLGAALTKELRNSLGVRSLSVKNGDTVRVTRGTHKGKEGKIVNIDAENYKIYVEGVTIKRNDKTERKVPIHPSNVVIINADTTDKKRLPVKGKK